jgi:hypothetical protein
MREQSTTSQPASAAIVLASTARIGLAAGLVDPLQ